MKEKDVKQELGEEPQKAPRDIPKADQDFIRLAMQRFKSEETCNGEERTRAKAEQDFIINKKQWDESSQFVKDRIAKGLPMLTFAHGETYIDNTIGEINQNLPRTKYRGVDNKTDAKQAEIRTSLMRHIEQISRADQQYYEALKQSVTSGYPAYLIVKNDYAYPDSFEQEIYLYHNPFQFSIKLDPNIRCYDNPDRGGAKWGSIEEVVSMTEFQKRYPNAQTGSIESDSKDEQGWWKKDEVRIASYYVAEPEESTLLLLQGGERVVKGSDEHKQLEEAAASAGAMLEVVRERKITKWTINHYVISSLEILEGPERIPGDCIPIVPVEGKYAWVDGKKKWRGVYTNAIDANKMENVWASKATEAALVGPRYKGTAAMFGDHMKLWQNPEGHRVLLHDWDPQLPGKSPEFDNANAIDARQSVEMMRYAAESRKSLTNIYDSSLGKQSNETSGRAIIARDQNANQTNYEFVSNLANSMVYVMRIVDAMIPEVYDYEKALRVIGDDGREQAEPVVINQQVPQDDGNGNIVKKILNDVSATRFDIVRDVGPSLKTQRMESADTIVKLAQTNPNIMGVAGDLLVKALDMPYSDELAKRLELILPPQVLQQIQQADDKQAAMQNAIKQAVEQQQQQAMVAFQAAEQKIQSLAQENAQLKAQVENKSSDVQTDRMKLEIEARKVAIDEQRVQLEAAKAAAEMAAKQAAPPQFVEQVNASLSAMQETIKRIMADHAEYMKGNGNGGEKQNMTFIIGKGGVRKEVSITAPNGQQYRGTVVEEAGDEPEGEE